VEIRATAEISVISPETATHKHTHRTVILEMVSMVPYTTHSLTYYIKQELSHIQKRVGA